MGRWMEAFSDFPDWEADYDERHPLRLADLPPHPLMYAADSLPGWAVEHFPLLSWIRPSIKPTKSNYDGEDLWLKTSQVSDLLDEFRHLRRISKRDAFIIGLDGAIVYKNWRGRHSEEEFNGWLDAIESVLEMTIEAEGVVLLSL
ncbi:MAG: hypothetical protein Rubg2KO_03670 [Rubricoccaceae bacterium]